MQFGRPIDAETDLGIRSREEPRPSLVEQEAVRLEAMFELEARRAALLDERERALVPIERNDERLARCQAISRRSPTSPLSKTSAQASSTVSRLIVAVERRSGR